MPNDSNYKIDLGFNPYCNSYSDSIPGGKSELKQVSDAQSGRSIFNILKSGEGDLSTILIHLSKDQQTISSNQNNQVQSHGLGSLNSYQQQSFNPKQGSTVIGSQPSNVHEVETFNKMQVKVKLEDDDMDPEIRREI